MPPHARPQWAGGPNASPAGTGSLITTASKDLQASMFITASSPPHLEIIAATLAARGLPLGGDLKSLLAPRENGDPSALVAGSFGFPRTLLFRLPKRRKKLGLGQKVAQPKQGLQTQMLGAMSFRNRSEPWACEQGLVPSGPAMTHAMVQHPPASARPSFWK